MNGHIGESTLNDHLEGLLSGDEAARVTAHVEACEACGAHLEALRALVADLGGLPLEAEPARDLWGGIRSRIEGEATEVLEFPAGRRVRRGPARVSMTRGQLLAAGLALAVVSGGTVALSLRAPNGSAPGSGEFVSPIPAVQAATDRYDRAIVEMEGLIEQGEGVLSSQTLEALQGSIEAIDRAIEDARRALATDPNSELLNRLLVNHQQAKLRVLQRTVDAMQL